MKYFIITILLATLCLLAFVGCDSGKASTIRAYSVPDGVEQYDGAEISANGKILPAYAVKVNTSQTWSGSKYNRVTNGVCLFELDGVAEVTVKPKTKIDYSSVVRPLSAKITAVANLQENTLKIKFKSAGEYVLEINGNPYDTIHFFVSSRDELGQSKYSGYQNVMVFEAGLHTSTNDSRIKASQNNLISLSDNTLVYLADGAVVRGRFFAQNASHIAVVGRGIVDGSTFERDATKNTVTVPFEFNYCNDVLMEDFTVLDPAGWTMSCYFMQNGTINNIKIISSRSNGDGISLQSDKNMHVNGCFLRTWDDSLVVKNYPRWDNRNVYGETENITFTNCTVWTELAQSMELGYETVGTKFSDVTFDNITVLHAMDAAAMSIHNANNAEMRNIVFKNITIEDGKNAADGIGLVDFRVLFSSTWSNQHTAPTPLGDVDGVTVENVKVISAKKFSAYIGGCYDTRAGFESTHIVSNVTIKNVEVAGVRPTREECRIRFTDAKYVQGFGFVQQDVAVTGATFNFTQTEQQLAGYGQKLHVEIV